MYRHFEKEGHSAPCTGAAPGGFPRFPETSQKVSKPHIDSVFERCHLYPTAIRNTLNAELLQQLLISDRRKRRPRLLQFSAQARGLAIELRPSV